MFEKCKKCGEYTFNGKKCNCKPFKVYYPEYYGYDPKPYMVFHISALLKKLQRNSIVGILYLTKISLNIRLRLQTKMGK